MNILVIDGFNSNSEGRKRFKAFHDAVVGGFETHWVHGLTVQVKRYDDLAEFVPSSGDNFIRVAPMKQFDKLDFVFVDGDLPLRPWSAQAQSVFKIMAMGVQTGKCIWASSFATPLVLCAINTHGTRDNIPPLVSAYPEGGTLDELRCLPPPTAPGQRTKEGRELPDELDSIFLDKKSGDCFDADFAVSPSSRARALVHLSPSPSPSPPLSLARPPSLSPSFFLCLRLSCPYYWRVALGRRSKRRGERAQKLSEARGAIIRAQVAISNGACMQTRPLLSCCLLPPAHARAPTHAHRGASTRATSLHSIAG